MSEDIDPETEEKQNYLRENILERGYDVNTFVSFLIEKKGEGGDDVANWSLPDLQGVVNEFIALNEQNKLIEENQNKIDEDINNNENENNNIEEKEEKEENDNKEKKEEINDWVDIDEKDKKNMPKDVQKTTSKEIKDTGGYGITSLKEIQCKTIPDNEITKCDNIQIKIEGFEKIVGKLFSKSYVIYTVVTSPFNWKVRRRFSDFEWLHQVLVNNFNYCLIPAFLNKKNLNKIGTDKFDKAFLRKRSRKFEKFLGYLINDPFLKNTQVVYDFLSIEKDDEFAKKKKTYEKKKISNNISEFFTLDGNANIEITEEKEFYLNSIKENTQDHETILKKLNASIKSLKDMLINASDKLKEISGIFKTLNKKAVKYAEKEDAVKCYDELSSMFDNLSITISKQNYIIYIYLREYFKFVKNNFRSMKDFIHIGENFKNSFYKSLKSLKSKKEDLFKKPDGKWELDPKEKLSKEELKNNKPLALEKILYKDTIDVNNKKQLYGFYLNRIIAEFERNQNVNAGRHLKIIVKIFQRQAEVYADFITTLTDNIEVLTKKGKKVKKKERKLKKDDYEEKLDLETPKKEDHLEAKKGKQSEEGVTQK